MKFEIGKYYENHEGHQLHVVSEANDNLIWNEGLVAINGLSDNVLYDSKFHSTTYNKKPDKFVIIGKHKKYTSSYFEIDKSKFRSILGLNSSDYTITKIFKVGKCYLMEDNGVKYTIHIISDFILNGQTFFVYECNSTFWLGSFERFLTHDIDIITSHYSEFKEIPKSEFKLLNFIYKDVAERDRLVRDIKLTKLLSI